MNGTLNPLSPWAAMVQKEIEHMHRNGATVDEIKYYLDHNAPKSAFGTPAPSAPRAAAPAEELPVDPNKWRDLFHTYQEFQESEPIKFAIKGWLQEDGITMYGGLPGHGKSLLGLSTAKALLTGKPLFGLPCFSVERSKRVLYLCPEVGLGPLKHRVNLFRLEPFIKSDGLLIRSLSAREPAVITDKRILKACEGADVFLDTAIRFMQGEENSATEQRVFAQNLFALLSAGARTVVGLHHAPKRFATDSYMDLDNALRGTNELGAMLSTAWATKQIDAENNWLYIQNIKARDFETCGAFVLEGRPHIDQTGDFKMIAQPGTAGPLRDHQGDKGGRPSSIDTAQGEQILRMKAEGAPYRKIADEVGCSKDAVYRFLRENFNKTVAKG